MEQVTRKKTREVPIGPVTIGGDQPIAVQSMTNTSTADREATIAQARELVEAGAEVIRVALPDREALAALPEIKAALPGTALVGDIHFTASLAIGALEAGCHKIRINPGNLQGGDDALARVVDAARAADAAIRVGVNSGSLDKDLVDRYGGPRAEALAEAAGRQVRRMEQLGWERTVVSIKSSDTLATLRACRLFAERFDYPQHLGITEAGPPPYGILKTAAGLGGLLLEGIGDTIRVSLSGDPLPEVKAAYDLLRATGRRVTSPEIISCPTCGRIRVNLPRLVKQVEKLVEGMHAPLRIALMGCAVNGPGEAREADIALAGGKGEGLIYRRGELIRKVPEAEMLAALKTEIDAMAAEMEGK